MSNALQIERTIKPKISFKHILLLILLAVAILILTNWFSIKSVANNSLNFKSDDLTQLVEEIYSAGEITDATNKTTKETRKTTRKAVTLH